MARATKIARKRYEKPSGFPARPDRPRPDRPGLAGSTEYPGDASDDRKAKRSEHRRQRRIKTRQSQVFCFQCRQTGHKVADCPTQSGKGAASICYRCGSLEHTLHGCPKPMRRDKDTGKEKLEYAQCFVCRKQGHLTSTCPDNANGKYPRGGECKICHGKDHFARDCPTVRPQDVSHGNVVATEGNPDEDAFHSYNRAIEQPKPRQTAAKSKKIVNF